MTNLHIFFFWLGFNLPTSYKWTGLSSEISTEGEETKTKNASVFQSVIAQAKFHAEHIFVQVDLINVVRNPNITGGVTLALWPPHTNHISQLLQEYIYEYSHRNYSFSQLIYYLCLQFYVKINR